MASSSRVSTSLCSGSNLSSVASTARAFSARAALISNTMALARSVQVDALGGDRAARSNDDLLDPGLGFLELRLAVALQNDPPLISRNRLVQPGRPLLEATNDGFQLGQRVLEAHRGNVVATAALSHEPSALPLRPPKDNQHYDAAVIIMMR